MVRLIRFPEEKCEALLRGSLGQAELDDLGVDNVRAILSEKGRTHYANVPGAMLGTDDGETRRARYTMITETALPPFDRVVLINGIDLREFKKRGAPLLFLHGHGDGESSNFPLGTVENLDKGALVRGTPAMVGDANFTAAEKWEFARLTWELVKAGVIRGGSIGFDIDGEREPTKEEVKRYGIRSMLSLITTKARLIEFSVVPLGRDPNAQVQRITNSYGQRIEALCRDGVCSRDAADDFVGMLTGQSVCSRSYHMAHDGWAAGVEDGDQGAHQRTEYADGPEGDCGGCKGTEKLQNAIARVESRLDAFDSRLARTEQAADDIDITAQLAGTVKGLRSELRLLRARQASFEAESREAYSLMRKEIGRESAPIAEQEPEPQREEETEPDEQMTESDFYAALLNEIGGEKSADEDHDTETTEG